MKGYSMELTVRVTYTKEDGSALTEGELRQLRRNLLNVPLHAAGGGAFTANCSDVLVETWDHDVAFVEADAGQEKPQWPRPTTN